MTHPPCLRLCPAYPGNPRKRIEGESPLQGEGHTVSAPCGLPACFDLRRYPRYFARRKAANSFTEGDIMDQETERLSAWSGWYLLFLVQVIAVLWSPFYNKLDPSWAGIPFFYLSQLVWVTS